LLENKDSKVEDLEKGYKELSDEIQKVGAEMYRAAGASSQDPNTASTAEDDDVKVYNKDEKDDKKKKKGKKGDDVVEGEVVEEEK